MPENCTRAFGRYLRTLRERRGLSLDQVYSLSQTFPERINKGYLSRCENGHQKLAFSKVVPLSRIYGVPADVLTERMELDMELDRVGGPETEGLTYAELVEAGKAEIETGRYWNAYALFRNAVNRAPLDPVQPSFRNHAEQHGIGQMACATVARRLGRVRFALHEFLYLESTTVLSAKFHPLVLERIASCYCSQMDLTRALEHTNRAIAEAEASSDPEFLAYLYTSRACIAIRQSDPATAASYFRKSYAENKAHNRSAECARGMNNIAQCYFDMRKYRSARRACEASLRISTAHRHHRPRALSMILLGEVDEIEEHAVQARHKWKKAARIAKELRDRELRFKAEFFLFRQALSNGDQPVARSIRRRLTKLVPWISTSMEELVAFKRLSA